MAEGRQLTKSETQVRMAIRRPGALVQLSFWPNEAGTVGPGASEALGLPFPEDGKRVESTATRHAYRIAPERLLVMDYIQSDLFGEARRGLPPGRGAVTDLGHARMLLTLSGAHAVGLLMRAVPLDVRTQVFPAGCFAQSFVQEASVLIHRKTDSDFSLLVPTSFADSLVSNLAYSIQLMQK